MDRQYKCFLSASYDTDLSLIKSVLAENNVETFDLYDFSIGSSIQDILKRKLRQADFAVFVVSKDSKNVLYEIGVCEGLGKPSLIIIDKDASLPFYIENKLSLTANLNDRAFLKMTLLGFIDEIKAKRKPTKKIEKSNDKTVVALNNTLNGQNSFGPAVTWSRNFGRTDRATQFEYDNYWDDFNTRPRLIGDINGDGKADLVGFGAKGVLVSLSNGSEFNCQRWINPGFDATNGFTNQNDFPRFIENISSTDSRDEIVGFGYAGVFGLNCNSGNVLRLSNNSTNNNTETESKVNNTETEIKIIPNPSNGIIDITLTNSDLNTNIIIYNSTGQIIREIKNVIGSTIIDISNNNNGFYFLRFVNSENGNVIGTKKIIIQKN